MAKDTAIITMEGEKETVPKLSNGATFNDLEWPLTHISTSNKSTNIQSCMIYPTVPFPVTLSDP